MTYKLLYKNADWQWWSSSDELVISPPTGKTWVVSNIFVYKQDTGSSDQFSDALTFKLSLAGNGTYGPEPTYDVYPMDPYNQYSQALNGSVELGGGMIIDSGKSLYVNKTDVLNPFFSQYNILIFGDEKTV